jgi:Uma2 family endonuclease
MIARTKPKSLSTPPHSSQRGEPTWEIINLFPRQGEWTEDEYFDLTDGTSLFTEYTKGLVRILDVAEAAAPTRRGRPTWEVAYMFPKQGHWTEHEYLALDTNRPIELSDGRLEFLPMPTDSHQGIAGFLYALLVAFVSSMDPGGRVRFASLPVRLRPGKFREPDILYMHSSNLRRCRELYWESADLAIEIVGPGSEARRRDTVTKRREYAQARVREYWIIDPQCSRVTVLVLDKRSYRTHGVFGSGRVATSVLLAGFAVGVDAVMAAARR